MSNVVLLKQRAGAQIQSHNNINAQREYIIYRQRYLRNKMIKNVKNIPHQNSLWLVIEIKQSWLSITSGCYFWKPRNYSGGN